jgi:hypothetical protein
MSEAPITQIGKNNLRMSSESVAYLLFVDCLFRLLGEAAPSRCIKEPLLLLEPTFLPIATTTSTRTYQLSQKAKFRQS